MAGKMRRSIDWGRLGAGAGAPRTRLVERPSPHAIVRAVAVAAAVVMVLRVVLPAPVPFGVLLFGLVIGSINALIAVGVILVYRSNRIINFALAEIGIFGAVLFEDLVRSRGVPWLLAIVAGLVASAALGGAVEYVFVRRFRKAPRLILTVVTIGIAELIVVATYGMNRLFGEQSGAQLVTPLSRLSIVITDVRFSGDALLLVACVPILVLGLQRVLKRTDFGVAVRASAESADRAGLLGVPVRRVSTMMWIVAAGFTALATMLRAPVVGVIAGSTLQGPGLLLRALAAAVLAGMENLRIAVYAALMIGVVEQSLYFSYGGSGIADVVFVVVIIAGPLLRARRQANRAEDTVADTWSVVEPVRPVPQMLARLPEVRWGRVGLTGTIVAAAVAYPFLAPVSKVNLASSIAIYAIVAVSLVVLTGWAGQISLGQFGIVGIGAAVTARLVADAHTDFFLALAAGALVGALIALVLGGAALRIKGFFFAVTSLGFAVAVETFFLDRNGFAALLPVNRPERPVLLSRFDLENETAFYLFTLFALAVVISTGLALRRSRTGRVLIAVRDNEEAAQAYGISHTRAKLTAFALSGAFAGLAGGMLAVHQHAVSATAYGPNESLIVFSMVVIGGLGSIPGAVLGAVYVRGAAFLLTPQLALLANGVGLLLVLLVLPGGLGRLVYNGRDALLRRIARRRGLVVPSLLADVQVAGAPAPHGASTLTSTHPPAAAVAS